MRFLSTLVNRWMFDTYTASPAALGVYRIAYSALALLMLVPTAAWLDDVPRAFFNPPVSLAALFAGFPSPAALYLLNAVAVVLLASAGAAAWGLAERATANPHTGLNGPGL